MGEFAILMRARNTREAVFAATGLFCGGGAEQTNQKEAESGALVKVKTYYQNKDKEVSGGGSNPSLEDVT